MMRQIISLPNTYRLNTRLSHIVLVIIALLSCSNWLSAATLRFPGDDAAMIGLSVVRLSDGKVITGVNQNKAMIPASTTKCITSAGVLLSVGDEFQYTTTVVLTGRQVDSILYGNLIIKGSGDPTIDSSHFNTLPKLADEIVDALKQRGITEIDGSIIVDDEWFVDPGVNPQWTVGDVGESYGPGLFGFNYADNLFTLYPATIDTAPFQPYADIILEPSDASIEVVHGTMSDTYIISGRGLERESTRLILPMNNPALSYGQNLTERLAQEGITVNGDDSDSENETVLLTHLSPSIYEIMQSMMRRSDNMMAEAMLRVQSRGSSRDDAIKAELNTLKAIGLTTDWMKINDGSGLARCNRVSPATLSSLLVKMTQTQWSKKYVALFPKVGREGTVKSLLKGTRLTGKLALKSGSINGVHCYAGYKLDNDGTPTHAVVIMINNFFCSRDKVRTAITKWLLDTF